MQINIELNENDLKKLVLDHLREKLGDIQLNERDVDIEVKSQQNFRSEWEKANFRARIMKHG